MRDNIIFYKILQFILCRPALQHIRILFYFYDRLILRFLRKPRKDTGGKKRVLVVFPLSLGDSVIFISSAACIRKIYPPGQYEVTLTCQAEYEELFTGYFDRILPVDYRRMSVSPVYRATCCKRFRRRRYDIAVDPCGCEECSPNVFVMNAVCADVKIGALSAGKKKQQCPAWMRRRIYSEIIYNPDNSLHRADYYAFLWSRIGRMDCRPAWMGLPSTYVEGLPERYFFMCPSANSPVKRWPVERFAEIARRIYRSTGLPLVLCGSNGDKAVLESLLGAIQDAIPCKCLIGQTSVRELIGIIDRAELIVTNDTGDYHIAVAQKKKVCVITGGYTYDYFIRYPAMESGVPQPVAVCPQEECMNCNNQCIYKVRKVYPCVEKNTVEEVWRAVQKLLETDGSR